MEAPCFPKFAYMTPDGCVGELGLEDACACSRSPKGCVAYMRPAEGVGLATCELHLSIVCVQPTEGPITPPIIPPRGKRSAF